MVRLKVPYSTIPPIITAAFQFQNGTIKSSGNSILFAILKRNFNSKMVRLKG